MKGVVVTGPNSFSSSYTTGDGVTGGGGGGAWGGSWGSGGSWSGGGELTKEQVQSKHY